MGSYSRVLSPPPGIGVLSSPKIPRRALLSWVLSGEHLPFQPAGTGVCAASTLPGGTGLPPRSPPLDRPPTSPRRGLQGPSSLKVRQEAGVQGTAAARFGGPRALPQAGMGGQHAPWTLTASPPKTRLGRS